MADEPPADAAPTATSSTRLPLQKADIVFPGNDGKSHEVGFDKHSFTIDGERINIWSGEIHYWRSPDVNSWRDLFQKMRANGYNAVSLYFFWGFHQMEENGEFDFEPGSIKDLDLLLTMAAEEGLYVIARPGPYVNAEISMGGLPAYMTNFRERLRSNEPRALEASKKWLKAFNEIAKKHLITDGGGSIIMYQVENELIADNQPRQDFLRELATFVKNDGIDVPLFHNDYGLGGRFRNVNALNLDFYAYDAYPVGFNCSNRRNPIGDSEDTFRRYAPNSPHFITESQGGAFTPWGARYQASDCYTYTDENFTRQWGVNNIGNGVTAFNFYMAFGGTNWGWTGAPASGFTSYDYGAGITEDRTMTAKSGVQKEIGYFIRSLPQLAGMDPVQAPAAEVATGGGVKTYRRQGPAEGSATGNGTQMIAIRHADSNNERTSEFTLPLSLGVAQGAEKVSYDLDDRNAALTYSDGWARVDEGSAYEGTFTQSKKAGDTLTFTFTGTGFTVITGTGVDHGEFTVKIDDAEPVPVTSARAEVEQNKPTQFAAYRAGDLPATEHTVVITNTGGETVSIDAIDVVEPPATEPVVHNDQGNEFITYEGAWDHVSGKNWTSGDINGDESFSSRQGDSYSFTFEGVGFDLVGPWSENHAYATVEVDGTVVGRTYEETTNSATPQKNLYTWRAADPSKSGTHTVKVTNTGERFANSRGTFTAIDAVRIYPDASSLPVETPAVQEGEIAWARVPQKDCAHLVLHGRDALLLTADHLIAGHKLYYTTSQLFGAPMNMPNGTLQYVVGKAGDPGETVLAYDEAPKVRGEGVESVWDADRKELRLNYTYADAPTEVTITPKGDLEPLTLRIVSRGYSQKVWLLEGRSAEGLVTTAVENAELARTVSYVDGVHLTGSASQAQDVLVISEIGEAPVTWNGAPLGTLANGVVKGSIAGPGAVEIPTLNFVRAHDNGFSAADFNDTSWKQITERQGNHNQQGPGTSRVVLDSNFHEFYEGTVFYRAHYVSDVADPTLYFRGNGGSGVPNQGRNPAFMQVWVNGTYAGAVNADGNRQALQVPRGVVAAGQDTVVTVAVHNLGQNLDWSDNGLSKQNRGLFEAQLSARNAEVTWKISGANAADARRAETNPSGTLYNNGGLAGEKAGWHMPSFDDSKWEAVSDLHTPAGISWYRARFTLNEPAGQQSAYRLDLNSARFAARGDAAQVTIFVNGWNTGVYIGDRGPQNSFVIPPAFLNTNGENVVALAVASKADTMGPESVTLRAVNTMTWPHVGTVTETPKEETPKEETPAKAVASSADSAIAGQKITFTASGFAAGETVTFEVHSDPVVAGTAQANAEGMATLEWTIPASFAVGEHTVYAFGADGVRSPGDRFVVTAAAQPPASSTPEAPAAPSDGAQSAKADAAQSGKTAQTNEVKPSTDADSGKSTDTTKKPAGKETKQSKKTAGASSTRGLATTGAIVGGALAVAALLGVSGSFLIRRRKD